MRFLLQFIICTLEIIWRLNLKLQLLMRGEFLNFWVWRLQFKLKLADHDLHLFQNFIVSLFLLDLNDFHWPFLNLVYFFKINRIFNLLSLFNFFWHKSMVNMNRMSSSSLRKDRSKVVFFLKFWYHPRFFF